MDATPRLPLGVALGAMLCTPIITLATASHAAPAPDPNPSPTAPRPRLVWGDATMCVQDPKGHRLRVQCHDAPAAPPTASEVLTGSPPTTNPPPPPPGDCLFAYDCRDHDATTASCARLERTNWCNDVAYDTQAYDELVAQGHKLIEADAEVQPGWYRDDEGRAFQVVFDLNRRYWIGVGWAMSAEEGGQTNATRVSLGAGFRIDDLDNDLKGKTRYTFLEGHVALDPFEIHATTFRFDRSVWGNDPFLRITTFVGKPRRHDLVAAIGGWGELGTIEHRPRGSREDTTLRFAGGGFTWDLWQDADMTSYLRLRGGAAAEEHFVGDADHGRFTATPLGALEGDFTLDDAGFHHLTLQSEFEAPFSESGLPGDDRIVSHLRFTNSLAYELILIAVDDQPVTLRAEVSGGYRDDLSDPRLNGWEVAADVGLRFSLWAPARDLAARDRAAELRKKEAR